MKKQIVVDVELKNFQIRAYCDTEEEQNRACLINAWNIENLKFHNSIPAHKSTSDSLDALFFQQQIHYGFASAPFAL